MYLGDHHDDGETAHTAGHVIVAHAEISCFDHNIVMIINRHNGRVYTCHLTCPGVDRIVRCVHYFDTLVGMASESNEKTNT